MPQRLVRLAGAALFVLATLAHAPLLAQQDSSDDSGWTTAWPNLGSATSLLLDPSNPSRLFAGTSSALATSVDGGKTWSLQAGTPAGLSTLTLDPSTPSRLVGGGVSGVFTSTDSGAHFTLSSSLPALAVAIDPVQPQTMYAGGMGKGKDFLQKTTDGGATWTSIGLDGWRIRAIAALVLDPANHENVLAGVGDWDYSYYYFDNSPSIIRSLDAGKDWTGLLGQQSDGSLPPVRALAFDPRTKEVLYAASGSYVDRTIDGGATWTPGTFSLGSSIGSLVIDSLHPDTIYAGTDQGVFRSTDAGAHWAPLPPIPGVYVSGLALDAPGQVLHAATSFGVYEKALAVEAPSYPCRPAADTLCLLNARFRVRAQAWDPRSGRFAAGHAVAETDAFGYFSLPDFTGDPSLPEVLLKMVDAEVDPWNADWVFHGGLTDLWYLVTITDTVTGRIRSYQNDPANPYCGGADTAAFAAAALPGAPPPSSFPPLEASGNALTLLSGRFELTLTATEPHTGRTISGRAIPRQDDFGYFSLPDLTGDNRLPEVFVKMFDVRASGDKFWLFQSTLTNVPFTLSLRDTVTNFTRDYPSSAAFCGGADTDIPDTP